MHIEAGQDDPVLDLTLVDRDRRHVHRRIDGKAAGVAMQEHTLRRLKAAAAEGGIDRGDQLIDRDGLTLVRKR